MYVGTEEGRVVRKREREEWEEGDERMNCSQAIIGEEILCISAAKTSREILNTTLMDEIEHDKTESVLRQIRSETLVEVLLCKYLCL